MPSRNGKKRRKGPIALLIIILLLIAALILMNYLGLGFGGKGSGDGGSTADTKSTVDESADNESSETQKQVVTVKVSGSTYIYNGAERTLEQLKSDFTLMDKTTVAVEITDDNATADAFTQLQTMLTDAGFSIIDSSSIAD